MTNTCVRSNCMSSLHCRTAKKKTAVQQCREDMKEGLSTVPADAAGKRADGDQHFNLASCITAAFMQLVKTTAACTHPTL